MCAPADNTSSGSKENKADDETSSVTESERSVESSANKDQSGGKRKKRVSWAVEKELRSYHYFELDETERGSNNCCKQAVMFSTPA